MGDKDEKLDGGFDQEEKPEVDAAQPEPVVKAPEPKAEPQPVESPKKKQVTAPAKKSPYAAGAKTLAPDTFKPGPEGKSAIGELTAFLQKNPSPAEIGQFLSKMQAQGRIGPASMAEVRKVIEKARGPEVAQRAIALAGFGGVVAGALGTQAEAPKTKAAPAPKASLAPVVQKKEEPGQKKGWYSSVKGWFSKGAEKVGNAASSVATATKNAYNRTKTALSDTWDVLSSSKVGYSKGTVTLETDVDELQDFLPQTKSMLALDKTKKADNKVSVAFDTKAKVMTVSAPSLAVSGMNFKGLRTGPAVITGVFVRITNPGHLKGGKALVDKNNPNDMQISVSVGSVTANAVAFQSAKGPISAQQAILNGITIWMKNSGGKVPFTDDAPDNINAGFKVGSMVLRGVEGAGVKADSLSVDNASALMDQGKETLDMGVGRIKAQGASYKGNKVTETEATDLSAHVDNKGGGLVGMDDKKDTLAKAEVTVGGVNVKDLKLTGGEAIQTLKAKGIKGTAENGGQQASVSVDKTAVTGLNSKQGSLASGEVGGLSASVDQTKKQAGAHIDYANLQGIAGSGAKVDSVGITSVSGTHDYGANHLSVSAGALDVKGADFSKFEHVRRDTAPDTVPATTTPGGTAAPTTPTTAKPALTTDFSLGKATVDDLKINPKSSVAHIGAENISGGSSGSDFNASVGHLGMRGVDTEKVDVGSVDVNGISATHHEGLKAKVKSVQVRDIGVAGVGHIDEAHASGISGSKTGDFTTSGTVNSFGASGIDAGKAQVSSVEGKGLAGSFNSKKGFSAAVKDVDVGQTTAGEAGFQSAHLSDLKAGSSP